jgi:Protein of unknown function (DUF4089)
MSDAPFDPDALITAMSIFLGLEIEPEYRQGVVTHLLASHRIAKSFLDLPLDDETEPAPVFVP